MKTIQNIAFAILILMALSCNGQTPEQKKQMEEAEKQAAEAQKQVEEVMKNNPELKKMMEQMKAMEERQEAEKKKKRAAEKKENAKKTAKHKEDFYWQGKVASNTNGKFSKWKHGAVDIAIYDGNGKMDANMQYIDKNYIILGNISSNGQVTINLPKTIKAPYPINKSLIREMHSLSNDDVSFSNPNTPFRNPGFTLSIIKNFKKLGSLFIGNSERVTYNLAAPCCLHYGDEGYRLYWVYIKDACSAKFDKIYKNKKIWHGEAEKIVDQRITYDLDFKPGWNLIKSEVIGHYNVDNRTIFKSKKHTVVPSLPADAKYYFKYETP